MTTATKDERILAKIESNYNTFRSIIEAKCPDRSEQILKMIDELEDRFATAPASTKLNLHNAFDGGYVDHVLNVLKWAVKFKSIIDPTISDESLVICAFFHDLGKIGDETAPLYVNQESEWHREKLGQNFTWNEDLTYMDVPTRGVYLIQHFGIPLHQEEFIAILTHDGPVNDVNKGFSMNKSALANVIEFADKIASLTEKDRESVLDSYRKLPSASQTVAE